MERLVAAVAQNTGICVVLGQTRGAGWQPPCPAGEHGYGWEMPQVLQHLWGCLAALRVGRYNSRRDFVKMRAQPKLR